MVSLGISKYWPSRLVVRTSGFHPEDRGSIPFSATLCPSHIPTAWMALLSAVGYKMRVSYNGNTSAFQADAVGSIPSIRS